jgi:gas vesicle protein
MSDNNATGAFLTGLLLGGLVGVAAALLITPQSGEATRVQIQTTGAHLKSQVGDKASSLKERGRVIVEERVTSTGGVENGRFVETEEIVEVLTQEDDSATSDA